MRAKEPAATSPTTGHPRPQKARPQIAQRHSTRPLDTRTQDPGSRLRARGPGRAGAKTPQAKPSPRGGVQALGELAANALAQGRAPAATSATASLRAPPHRSRVPDHQVRGSGWLKHGSAYGHAQDHQGTGDAGRPHPHPPRPGPAVSHDDDVPRRLALNPSARTCRLA